MTTTDLAADMAAMGFEEVPPSSGLSRRMGNRDFQRGGTLIRFWNFTGELVWSYIVYKEIPSEYRLSLSFEQGDVYEVAEYIGHGLAALCVFLAKGATA